MRLDCKSRPARSRPLVSPPPPPIRSAPPTADTLVCAPPPATHYPLPTIHYNPLPYPAVEAQRHLRELALDHRHRRLDAVRERAPGLPDDAIRTRRQQQRKAPVDTRARLGHHRRTLPD